MQPEDAAEYQAVAESVMRECIINLARIKETISQSLASDAPSQGLDSVPILVRGIKAGLLMLNKTRAMEVIERLGKIISLTLKHGGPAILGQKETDRLADAIVSIEYYMETVKAGRSEPWYMLDNAEACLSVLRDVEHRLEQEPAPEPEQADAAAPDPTQKIQRPDMAAIEQQVLQEQQVQSTAVMPLPVVAPDAEHLDPELLEIFIEEAKEEVASIKRNLPDMDRRPRRHGGADYGQAFLPYAQGQRPDGGRGTHRRILLERGKPAQQTYQSNHGAYATDG